MFDPAAMQGEIDKLNQQLKDKDAEYAAKEADRIFSDTIKEAIKTAGGRNEKAVMAMLDMDALKESKNQSEDIKKALETVKESDAYLFGSDEPFKNPVEQLAALVARLVETCILLCERRWGFHQKNSKQY